MNEFLAGVLALAAGILMGTIFFGGLWWTVQKVVSSEHPMLWFFGSLVLRMGIVIAGLYFIGRGRWERLLLCLCGFVAARFIVIRFTRPPDKEAKPAREANHAP
jgi:F1F0 ATPase subunit 2